MAVTGDSAEILPVERVAQTLVAYYLENGAELTNELFKATIAARKLNLVESIVLRRLFHEKLKTAAKRLPDTDPRRYLMADLSRDSE